MIDESLMDQMKNGLEHMKNPVRLILFTRDHGCDACSGAQDLVKAIKSRSPRIALEVYDQIMDRDKAEQYRINAVPAIVVQGGNGRLVTFYGQMESDFLKILIDTIIAASEGKIWFPENIRRTLNHLEKEVPIRVFVEANCLKCRPVAETAIGLAFENDLVDTDIIVVGDFPDLIRKYSIKTLPKTLFGSNLQMDGHVTESEFLEMIFQAEGSQQGPDKRCLVCGNLSPDIICANCKTRIQAEAVDHKRKSEKLSQTEPL